MLKRLSLSFAIFSRPLRPVDPVCSSLFSFSYRRPIFVVRKARQWYKETLEELTKKKLGSSISAATTSMAAAARRVLYTNTHHDRHFSDTSAFPKSKSWQGRTRDILFLNLLGACKPCFVQKMRVLSTGKSASNYPPFRSDSCLGSASLWFCTPLTLALLSPPVPFFFFDI